MKEFYKPTGGNGDNKESDASLGDGTDPSGVVIPKRCQGCPYAEKIVDAYNETAAKAKKRKDMLKFAKCALIYSGHTNKLLRESGSDTDKVLRELYSTIDEELAKIDMGIRSAANEAQNDINRMTTGCRGFLRPKILASDIVHSTNKDTMCDSPALYGDKPARNDTYDPEEAPEQYISGLRGALQPVDDGEEDYSVTSRRLIEEIRDTDDDES